MIHLSINRENAEKQSGKLVHLVNDKRPKRYYNVEQTAFELTFSTPNNCNYEELGMTYESPYQPKFVGRPMKELLISFTKDGIEELSLDGINIPLDTIYFFHLLYATTTSFTILISSDSEGRWSYRTWQERNKEALQAYFDHIKQIHAYIRSGNKQADLSMS